MANKKIENDYSNMFLDQVDLDISVSDLVGMGLIPQKTMRDFVIVKEVWRLLQVERMKFKRVLQEVADMVECSPEHVYRVYSNNRKYLK